MTMLLSSLSAEAVSVFGHRGARGLSPENTLPAIQTAIDHHVDAIDLDIVMSKDGVLVVYHNLNLNPDITRDTDGKWLKEPEPVKHLTLAELKTYDVGRIKPGTWYASMYASQVPVDHTQIPTLQEAIRYIKKHADYPIGFQIEIKTDPTKPDLSSSSDKVTRALYELIEAEGIADRTKVQAFDWYCLLLLQELNPTIETAYLTSLEHTNLMKHPDPDIAGQWTAGRLLKDHHSIPDMINDLGGTWWDAEDVEITEDDINQAHGLGLKVAAWPWPERSNKQDVNLPLTKQLITLGIDGIITDRPDLVKAMINQ